MAVKATATCMGKKSAKTGIKRVPSPKPEKRVNPEVMSAEIEIIKYSMFNPISYKHLLYNLICSPVLFLRIPRFIKKMKATKPSTKDALIKDFERLKYVATIPEIKGPVVWPMSIMEPRIPIAEPRPSALLRSAMKADVADVTTDKLNPKKMLKTNNGRKVLNNEKLPIQSEPINAPKKICGFLPCLSENLPITGFISARVMT